MLDIYCWNCGTKIDEKAILGLGHFDQNIGKYQGKAFITFKCNTCNKVRYQILNKSLFSRQKNMIKKMKKENSQMQNNGKNGDKITFNHVIDFYKSLDDVDSIDDLLSKFHKSVNISEAYYTKYKNPIIQPLDVFNLFKDLNEDNLKRMMVLTLDNNNFPVTWEFLGEGLSRKISYQPKVIFHTPFLLKEEVSIIIAENIHNMSSQPEEKYMTKIKKLVKSGNFLGVKLLDYIIIGNNSYKSYDELNLI